MNEQFYSDLWVRDQGESWDYRVDLVRESLDDNGLKRQQRLNVAIYPSQGEAEEHQAELDQTLAQDGIAGLGKLPDKVRGQEYEITHYCIAVQPEAEQWLDSADEQVHLALIAYSADHVSTATLASGDRRTLDRYAMSLEDTQALHGDDLLLTVAHDFAVEQGQIAHGKLLFADQIPATEQDLSSDLEYYFGYGVGPNNQPALEVVKTWMDGTERRFDTLTLVEHPTFDEVMVDELRLEQIMADQGLEQAMQKAEEMAETNGYIDIDRVDSRLFFQDDAPDDPFETLRAVEFREYSDFYDVTPVDPANLSDEARELQERREARASLEGVAWFEAGFTDKQLIEPLDDTVNYAFVVQDTDPWTLELMVDKYWKSANGYVGFDSVTLKTYDPDDEVEREQADQDRDSLMQSADDLSGMMQNAEQMAVENGYLKADRANPSLFRKGPPDRFETLAERLIKENDPDVESVDNPHWRFDTLPITDPEGQELGVALHMVRYPTVEAQPNIIGSPSIPDDAPFELLEVAHFPTRDDADVFVDRFVGYLSDDLTAPELAEEVARGEGLSAEWKTLDEAELQAYQDLSLDVTKDGKELHHYKQGFEVDNLFQELDL